MKSSSRVRIEAGKWLGENLSLVTERMGSAASPHVIEALGILGRCAALDLCELFVGDVRWMRATLEARDADLGARYAASISRIFDAWISLAPAPHKFTLAVLGADVCDAMREATLPSTFVGDGSLAARYLEAFVHGDEAASVLVDACGRTPVELYDEVLGPAQWEVGRLWQAGQLDIEQEQRRTRMTLQLVRRHRPAGRRERALGTLAAVSAPGEGHDIGLRMVTNLLWHDGWNTAFLGSNLSADAVLAGLRDRRPELIAFSAATNARALDLGSLLVRMREDAELAQVPVIVGGQAFRNFPGLAERIGADGWARNGDDAVRLARRFSPHYSFELRG